MTDDQEQRTRREIIRAYGIITLATIGVMLLAVAAFMAIYYFLE